MKALIMDEERRMVVKEMPEPTASEDNIIIKVYSASICGTDMRTFLKGNAKITPPRIMGHECAGEIIHAGALAKEKGWKEGDRVTVAPAVGCGECVPCKKGHTNMCDHLETIGFQYEGVFAPYAEIPKQAILMNNVIKLDDSISYDDATLIEPAACALNGQSYLHIEKGDTVVIYGSGIIGCIHAELAFIKGASRVIIVEPVEKRGHIAMEKVPGESKGYLDSNLIHYKELLVCGVHATTAGFMREIMKLMEEGKLDAKKYIERFTDMDHILDAFAAIRDENVMKVVIHPQG